MPDAIAVGDHRGRPIDPLRHRRREHRPVRGHCRGQPQQVLPGPAGQHPGQHGAVVGLMPFQAQHGDGHLLAGQGAGGGQVGGEAGADHAMADQDDP
ncbi:MAG: hypothetical protein IPL43_07760 [Micropruina sp.]|nr:hypothetical protein [Micropruina sp.]